MADRERIVWRSLVMIIAQRYPINQVILKLR
jgi:hypothetical protein